MDKADWMDLDQALIEMSIESMSELDLQFVQDLDKEDRDV